MYKLKLTLKPKTEEVNIYNVPEGYVFRAYLIRWLKELEPKLLHKYHDYNSIRPYSINVWIHKKKNTIDYTMHFFDNSVGEMLLDDITSDHHEIQINKYKFSIYNIEFGPINLSTVYDASKPIKSYTLYFPKPTYFNTLEGNYPIRLPVPADIYSNLLSITEEVASTNGFYYDEKINYYSWLKAHIYVSGHDIKTVQNHVKTHQSAVGFVGHVSFKIKKPNSHYYENLEKTYRPSSVEKNHLANCKWTHFLNRLATYTNVGVNRTAGFGVVNYHPKNHFKQI
jgi:hypothetical protein